MLLLEQRGSYFGFPFFITGVCLSVAMRCIRFSSISFISVRLVGVFHRLSNSRTAALNQDLLRKGWAFSSAHLNIASLFSG